MSAYYNEIDPYCAQWLRNLISAGHIAAGDVDTRSIVDVRADDLKGYRQCHFFAGIGGWSLALRLAAWPDDRPVWTGSCPCQPFSVAGKGKAFNDERHLWPAWFSLIAECHPPVIFGEQVEAAIGWGWLDAVFADLEAEGYACGTSVLPACSVGAPHIRQRCYLVADGDGDGRTEQRSCGLLDRERPAQRHNTDGCGKDGVDLVDAIKPRLEGHAGHGVDRDQPGRIRADETGSIAATGSDGFWSDAIWLPCRDGKARPAKPGIFPLAHGVPARVGKLRAAGNAISPQVAEAFIRASDMRFAT